MTDRLDINCGQNAEAQHTAVDAVRQQLGGEAMTAAAVDLPALALGMGRSDLLGQLKDIIQKNKERAADNELLEMTRSRPNSLEVDLLVLQTMNAIAHSEFDRAIREGDTLWADLMFRNRNF